MLNAEEDSFYFLSLSRHHPQRIQASRRLSKPASALPAPDHCSSAAQPDEALLAGGAAFQALEADSEVRLEFALIQICVQGRSVLLLALVLTFSVYCRVKTRCVSALLLMVPVA